MFLLHQWVRMTVPAPLLCSLCARAHLCLCFSLSFSPPPFVCDCVIVQFAHSRAVMDCPSPEQLPDSPALPRKETIRANKKTNNAGREISKNIQGNVLLQRQEQGPPGAHYCSRWDEERGSCSMDPRRWRNQKGRVRGSGEGRVAQEMQFRYF